MCDRFQFWFTTVHFHQSQHPGRTRLLWNSDVVKLPNVTTYHPLIIVTWVTIDTTLVVSSQQQGLTWGQRGWSLQYIYHPSLLLRLRTIYWKENYSSGYTIHYTLYYTQYNTIQYNVLERKLFYGLYYTLYTLHNIHLYRTGQLAQPSPKAVTLTLGRQFYCTPNNSQMVQTTSKWPNVSIIAWYL